MTAPHPLLISAERGLLEGRQPFAGGVTDTGFGREGILYALEGMTEPRTSIWNLG